MKDERDTRARLCIGLCHLWGHGRLERRVAAVAQDIAWLQEGHHWPGLCSIGSITATAWKKGKETKETRYYISSLPLEAGRLNEVARQH